MSLIFAQLKARQQIQDCKHSHNSDLYSIKWLVKGAWEELVAAWRKFQTIPIPRAIGYASHGTVDKTDLRKWPAYYDSTRRCSAR
jgi:hypothetical protein